VFRTAGTSRRSALPINNWTSGSGTPVGGPFVPPTDKVEWAFVI
jgi:hypothetical protein